MNNKKESGCRELASDADNVSIDSRVSELSSQPPSMVDDSSASDDGGDIIQELGNPLEFGNPFPLESVQVPSYTDMDNISSSSSRVSELSSQVPSLVDDSSTIYDDDLLDELGDSFPLESIQVPSVMESTCSGLSSHGMSDDDILEWVHSIHRNQSDSNIVPFKHEMLEELLDSLPTRSNHESPKKTKEVVFDWERVAPKARVAKRMPKENELIPSWLHVRFPFHHLLEAKTEGDTLQWIRSASQTFFDSFTSSVVDRLLSWTEFLDEVDQRVNDSTSPPTPIERTSSPSDAPKDGHMVRGEMTFDIQSEQGKDPTECHGTFKSYKWNDESSVESLGTLETHISRFSDDHSWSWRVAEV